MKKFDSPTIHVALSKEGHPDDCNCGKHYSATVMAFNPISRGWYNTGIVCWENSPEEAFAAAKKRFEEYYGG
jgi:hypothetical protein